MWLTVQYCAASGNSCKTSCSSVIIDLISSRRKVGHEDHKNRSESDRLSNQCAWIHPDRELLVQQTDTYAAVDVNISCLFARVKIATVKAKRRVKKQMMSNLAVWSFTK